MKDPKEIWDEDELMDAVEDDVDDGREVPVYEFLYKQAVQSTDVFLGMSGKDESSTSCEDMVLRIELPGVSSASGARELSSASCLTRLRMMMTTLPPIVSELDLDVKPTYVKLNHAR